ncbi:MAG: ATP-dependent DNA helicase RecG [Vulcanimicrobiaceae bacterium]
MLISELSGVGKDSAAKFAELGVRTSGDLLAHFPHRYEDLRQPTPALELRAADTDQNALGTILAVRERRARLPIVEADIRDESGSFTAKWFGRRYLLGSLKPGMRIFVRGRVTRTLTGPAMNVSVHRLLNDGESYHGEIVPIYPASKALTSRRIRQVIARNFPALVAAATDFLPPRIAQHFAFPSAQEAYRDIHFPPTPEAAQTARERFIFTEFLALALAAQLKRATRETQERAQAMRLPSGLLDELEGALPFALTGAQRRVIGEIWHDMTRESPMNRLLQGDVGSGKTLVAAAAMIMASRNGMQSALMAPTEILAAQHAAKLAPLLLPFGIAVEAVFGSQTARMRSQATARLSTGEARLAVGTHALLTEGVDFAHLGLVVIDEQHRFGVEQRARLRAKGLWPHTLHMTATPIPRTLAQSIYADLDFSVIDELPPGRTPIKTFSLRRSRLFKAYAFIRGCVERGEQAYIVAPVIDESEAGLTSVVAEYERLRADELAGLRLGLLHGRLSARDKEDVMRRFARHEVDVLISTTVIEVGVDVANASAMLVLDAQRYGLAQLHQLRGRVGRGAAHSYCLLVVPDEAAERERLDILVNSTDGFEISEHDMRLRGPGEFAGTAQSGLGEFKIADLVRDVQIYQRAKECAQTIVREDPELRAAEHQALQALMASEPSARAMLVSS